MITHPGTHKAQAEEICLIDLLAEAAKGIYTGFDARFSEVKYVWEENGLNVSGNFFYPPFGGDGQPTTDHLVTWLYHQIISFCIPQVERDKALDRLIKTGEDRHFIELHDKARSLFVRARESQKTTGEPGELLLFTMLEAVLNAPQIACKMYLKTNENVPVHGSDSIHAMIGEMGYNLRIVWGESKTYKDLPSAIKKIFISLNEFYTSDFTGRSPRDRDIDIIKDHLNITDPVLKSVVLDYLDPYNHKSNQLEEMVTCLVSYEGPMYKKLKGRAPSEVDKQFRMFYEAAIKDACSQFSNHIRKAGLENLRLHLFLLPVPSIQEFRIAFFQKLGIPTALMGTAEGDDCD